MDDYISRKAACNALDSEGYTKNMRVHKKILVIPATDVVEVVRCENCAEWQRGWNPVSTPNGVHFCAITGLFTEPDWFCKDGNISEVEEDNG